jgi:hypothetical protein
MNGIPSGIIQNAGLLGMPRTSREALVRWENHRTSWDITGNYPTWLWNIAMDAMAHRNRS